MIHNILRNQDHLCVSMNNEQGCRRKENRPWSGCSHQKEGSAAWGGRATEKNKQTGAHLSLRAPMNAALCSQQGPTAKSLEWSCTTRRRNVCVHLGFHANLIEFSRNFPGTTESLESGLQRLSVYISACKHESTCPKEHFTPWFVLICMFTPIHFSYRDSCWWMSQLLVCRSCCLPCVAVLSIDVSGACQKYCCHAFKAAWTSFLLSFPPYSHISVNRVTRVDEICLGLSHTHTHMLVLYIIT